MLQSYNNPLLDKDFLAELDAYREREVYAKIIALNFQEQPIEQIEGQVTQGSINIDGASAVRRTCSLTLVAKDLDINDFYWGIKSKFKLEIGLRNTIKNRSYGFDADGKEAYWGDKYPQDIIWFPQGIYAINGFNTSYATNSYTVSISGKDKMCFLNGDLGGSLTSSIDFGVEEFYDSVTNSTTFTAIPIKKIIQEAVHFYAGEPYYNIVINDLEDAAVELLEYRGDSPLYLLRNDMGEFDNYTDNGEAKVYFADGGSVETAFDISALEEHGGYYDPRVELAPEAQAIEPSKLYFVGSNKIYTVAKIEFGQTVGYRQTELTYAGDLISNIGESLTSILDKIKNMLGEYEYFYDLEGRFIFQKKKTYIQTSWNNIVKIGDEEYVDTVAHTSSVAYRFEDSKLITSFSNSPNLSNLKNDYSVWGERESVSGEKLPIHYRYAIDTKPTIYTTLRIEEEDIKGHNSIHPESPLYAQEPKEYKSDEYDWRELIYQMAQDYYKYNQLDCYTARLIESNPITCAYGTTGYEQYYSDIFSFWRELYDSNPKPYYSAYNKMGDDEHFQYKDTENNTISLFIKGQYKIIDNPKEYLTDDVRVLKKISYTSVDDIVIDRYELVKWLDAIEIDYYDSFTEKDPEDEKDLMSTTFYVTGPNDDDGKATYIPIRKSVSGQLKKSEIFVKEKQEDGSEEYFNLLNSSYALNSIGTDAKFCTFIDDKTYYDVTTGDVELQQLYGFYDENGEWWYNRYLYSSNFDIEGKPINNSLAVKYSIEYSGEGYSYIIDEGSKYKYWTTDLLNAPSQLIFWFDFLDGAPWWTVENQETGEISIYYDYEELQEAKSTGKLGTSPRITQKATDLSQFSVKQVGDRTKAVNDSSVTAIYFREVPNLVFTTVKDYLNSDLKYQSGYIPVFMTGNLESMFSISAQGKSAQDALDELLYNHSYCIESVTIQAIPIYYLQPNVRIFVRDDASKINGEYIVSKITIPLAYNGTMSITATKAPERLY